MSLSWNNLFTWSVSLLARNSWPHADARHLLTIISSNIFVAIAVSPEARVSTAVAGSNIGFVANGAGQEWRRHFLPIISSNMFVAMAESPGARVSTSFAVSDTGFVAGGPGQE